MWHETVTTSLLSCLVVCSSASSLFERQIYHVAQSKVCNATEYGASTSLTDNADHIQAAIDACSDGGVVLLDGGEYNSGPLVVTGTKVTFEVTAGTSLKMAFPPIDNHDGSTWPSHSGNYIDVLVFKDCNGCTLTGQGLLHGGGIFHEWCGDGGCCGFKCFLALTSAILRNLNVQVLLVRSRKVEQEQAPLFGHKRLQRFHVVRKSYTSRRSQVQCRHQ